MVGRTYAMFDTSLGRCGIAWSDGGVIGVQLPAMREIETRRELLRRFPDARERTPPPEVAPAIDAVSSALRGQSHAAAGLPLDMTSAPPFSRRVYELLQRVPRGETVSFDEIASRLGMTGVIHSVKQAISRNPFPVLVPCHRAVPSHGETSGAPTFGGIVTRSRLLALEGALAGRGVTLFDALLSLAPPPRSAESA